MRYASHLSRRNTPQSERIPGERQIRNAAGGYVYATDRWNRLNRFLVLGTDGGTFYASERKLTRENADVVRLCLEEDAARTVDAIVAVSDAGRAPKNDPAVLALAIAAASPDVAARRLAYAALPQVCRIPTHLFHFLAFSRELRGWSRGLRTAVARWYGDRDERLPYDLLKYQARDGWAHRDALRLAHPRLPSGSQAALRWAVGAVPGTRAVTRRTNDGAERTYASGELPAVIAAFEEAKTAEKTRVIELIREHNLTREMVPTTMLAKREVWEALLERMPLGAMIRNLGKMTAVGLVAPLSAAAATVAGRLADERHLRKSRVHPLNVLNALRTYAQGHGERGSLRWEPVQSVVDALDAAFYAAFGNVEPTGRRILLALDVSGSMGYRVAGTSLSCRDAAAALALVTANVERDYAIVGFTSGRREYTGWTFGRYLRNGSAISPLRISPRQRLDDVVRYTSGLDFGATDCALPMLYASEKNLDVDAFVVITDNESWAGAVHPSQALRQYRKARVAGARLAVNAMTATRYSVADPKDPGMLDLVGFDLATPQAMAEFIRS